MDLGILEACLKNVDSRYRAVLLAARRSKQLQKGAASQLKGKFIKPTTQALNELAKNLLKYDVQTEGEAESEVFFSETNQIVSSSDLTEPRDIE